MRRLMVAGILPTSLDPGLAWGVASIFCITTVCFSGPATKAPTKVEHHRVTVVQHLTSREYPVSGRFMKPPLPSTEALLTSIPMPSREVKGRQNLPLPGNRAVNKGEQKAMPLRTVGSNQGMVLQVMSEGLISEKKRTHWSRKLEPGFHFEGRVG